MSLLNKHFKFLVITNVLIAILAGFLLGVPGDCIPFWITIIALSGIFVIFSSGWRRWISIGFVILGILLLRGEIIASLIWQEKKLDLRNKLIPSKKKNLLNVGTNEQTLIGTNFPVEKQK